MPTTARLLTPMQAAEQLAVGRTKMFELIRTCEVESIKVGRARRIPEGALERFVERHLSVPA